MAKITKTMLQNQNLKLKICCGIISVIIIAIVICSICFVGLKFDYVEAAFKNTPLQTTSVVTPTDTPTDTPEPIVEEPEEPVKVATAMVLNEQYDGIYINSNINSNEQILSLLKQLTTEEDPYCILAEFVQEETEVYITILNLKAVGIENATEDDFMIYLFSEEFIPCMNVLYSTMEFNFDGVIAAEGFNTILTESNYCSLGSSFELIKNYNSSFDDESTQDLLEASKQLTNLILSSTEF